MAYFPRRPAQHETIELNHLKFHVHRWPAIGRDVEPIPIILLHGWGDTGETFQFVVDHMPDKYTLLAIDQRGFGRTQWPESGYYFPDYVADVDAWLDIVSPTEPVMLVGHSMGGNVASLYAGIRPERVQRWVNLEGFGVTPASSEEAPQRYRQWLDQIKSGTQFANFAIYPDYRRLAEVLLRQHRHLPLERADFIARAWGYENAQGQVELRADPRHKRVNPVLYRLDESRACWQEVTAPLLFIAAEESKHYQRVREMFTLEKLQADFKSVELAMVQEAGHMLHLEQPEHIAQLLTKFLES